MLSWAVFALISIVVICLSPVFLCVSAWVMGRYGQPDCFCTMKLDDCNGMFNRFAFTVQ